MTYAKRSDNKLFVCIYTLHKILFNVYFMYLAVTPGYGPKIKVMLVSLHVSVFNQKMLMDLHGFFVVTD